MSHIEKKKQVKVKKKEEKKRKEKKNKEGDALTRINKWRKGMKMD